MKTIKTLREERGLSFYALEKQMKSQGFKVDRQNLARWEKGEGMTLSTLRMFSKFYNVRLVVDGEKPVEVIE